MSTINLDGRVFVPVENSPAGTATGETTFRFSQDGALITARYSGGPVINGHIIGHFLQADQADLLYHCVTADGDLKAGHAIATFSDLPDGRLRIDMGWRWLNGEGEGTSRYEEVHEP